MAERHEKLYSLSRYSGYWPEKTRRTVLISASSLPGLLGVGEIFVSGKRIAYPNACRFVVLYRIERCNAPLWERSIITIN